MDLKEFVTKVIVDLDQAVSEADRQTNREIRFKGYKDNRTAVEFDVAVTVEATNSTTGGGGIKVWGMADVDGRMATENRNSTISRVSFAIAIDEKTKQEKMVQNAAIRGQFNPRINEAR